MIQGYQPAIDHKLEKALRKKQQAREKRIRLRAERIRKKGAHACLWESWDGNEFDGYDFQS